MIVETFGEHGDDREPERRPDEPEPTNQLLFGVGIDHRGQAEAEQHADDTPGVDQQDATTAHVDVLSCNRSDAEPDVAEEQLEWKEAVFEDVFSGEIVEPQS